MAERAAILTSSGERPGESVLAERESILPLFGPSAFFDEEYERFVVGAETGDGSVRVTKEFWGGITADYEVQTPAVLGIQAARQAP